MSGGDLGFDNNRYFLDAHPVFASCTEACLTAVILTIEGITRLVQNQTNKHLILSHVSHPP